MDFIPSRIFIIMALAVSTPGTVLRADQIPPVREIVSQLRRYDGKQHRDVPATVYDRLVLLKHTLRDMIVQVATAPDAFRMEPEALTSRVIDLLAREDVPVGDEGGFGAIPGIEIRRSREYPAWLIAATSLSIPYGVDTSLYVFETNGTSWKHVMTVEASRYTDISGAQGWMTYYVAPTTAGTKPYLVTADISPSDVSVWQALRIKVLRVGDKPNAPTVLATRTLGYCLDDSYYLSMHPGGFGLIYLGSPVDRELAGWRGVHYLQYSVTNDKAIIAADVAVDPYNLVRKWVAADWPRAARLVDAEAENNLREWHARFRSDQPTCGLGETHVTHRSGQYEQLLSVAACTRGDADEPSAWVVLAPSRKGFRISSISGVKPTLPESTGETIYTAGGPDLIDPVPESAPQPTLPSGVPANGGPVTLRLGITVNDDGTVGTVSVVRWPDDPYRIVVRAIEAVRRWKYKPGSKDGHPVKVGTEVEVVFQQ